MNRLPTVEQQAAEAMAHGIPVVGTKGEAAIIRLQLKKLGLSQMGAARELEVHHRDLRYWCAGRYKPPRCVMLALERLVELQGGVR